MWCTHDACDAWVLKLWNIICKQVDYKTCVYIKENELQNANHIEQVCYITWIGGLTYQWVHIWNMSKWAHYTRQEKL